MRESRSTGGRGAVALWAGCETTNRWKSLIALGLLVGLSGGFTFSAIAGARRTATAYARFRAATGRSDAIVFATQLGIFNADYSAVRALRHVADAGEFALAPLGIKELPGVGTLAPNDEHLYRTIDRPLLVSGRLPNPRRADEIAVNRKAAELFHLHLGQRVTLISATNINAFFGTAPLTGGPSVRATIVGIGDSNMDLVFGVDKPSFIPSAGFLVKYKSVPRAGNLIVRLRPGTDIATFRQEVARAMHEPNIPVRDESEDAKRIVHGTDLERTALLLLAGCAALAGMLLSGQALSRTVYGAAEAAPTLHAIGFTRGNLVAGLTVPLALAGITGAFASFGIGLALSSRFPVGLAGRLDPDRAFHVDWPVLGFGGFLLILAVMGGATFAALRATRRVPDRPSASAGSPIVRVLRKFAPLPASLGASLALERGKGPRTLPVRPALAGGIVGLLGIVGAFGLIRGIDDALRYPDRSGQVWSIDVFTDPQHPQAALMSALQSERAVSVIAEQRRVDLNVDGAGVPVYALTLAKGGQSFLVLHGREPSSSDEVALGPATARALHKSVGDVVRIGLARPIDAHVVGLALLPQTPHSSFDQGGWMSAEGLSALAPPPSNPLERTIENTLEARFAPGQPTAAVVGRLQQKLGGNADIEPEGLPQDVLYLRNVRSLPKALAIFLGILGVGAVGHVLFTAVRRRGHDLGVLRALGFRPLQAASCLLWQAVTFVTVGLLIGVPLGVAAGRWSWSWVAAATPLRYVPPFAGFAVAVTIPAALVVSNMLAAAPARRSARLRPAEVLRTE